MRNILCVILMSASGEFTIQIGDYSLGTCVPVWSLGKVVAGQDGTFIIVY